jgi:hypothetical protein
MRNIKYTTEEYAAQIRERNIVPIDSYIGVHTKIGHRCLTCDHTWSSTPGAIRNGHGCPHCYQLSVRKPYELVEVQCQNLGWKLVDPASYINSYVPLLFRHSCGEIVRSNLDRILRKSKRCLICNPIKTRKTWAVPCSVNGRSYSSKLEMECCEYLVAMFGEDDIILQKPYSIKRKQTADAYIKSIDTFVEVSSINKPFYLDRISDKRKLVKNFVFVSAFNQLPLFFK